MRRVRRSVVAAVCVLSMLLVALPASAAAGAVDTSFATTGLLTQPNAGVGQRVLISPGPAGRFVLAWCNAGQVGVSGFLGTGSSDGGFGTGGSSTIAVPGAVSLDTVDSLADAQDRTLVVGYAAIAGGSQMFVARFTPTGMPDTTFSGDGVKTISFTKGDSYGYGIAVRGDKIAISGEVYTSGSSVADPAVVRLDDTGRLDPAFGSGGRKLYEIDDGFAGDDWAYRIQPVRHGRFVLAGGVTTAQGFSTLVMRIRADGHLDTSFRGGGAFITNLHKGDDDYTTGLERDGGKLVLGIGGDTTKPTFMRLRSDGSRDATFGSNGVVRFSKTFDVTALTVDGNHRVIATSYSSSLPVIRVKANGSLASGFGTAGVAKNTDTLALGIDVMLQGSLILVSGGVQSSSINATRYLS